MNRYLLSGVACLLAAQSQAQTRVDPSSLRVKVYQVWVSANGDCSSPILAIDNSAAPTYVDFFGNPTLGEGAVPDGTYPCVMIKMSDLIKFKPSANADSLCVAGTEYTLDVCNSGESVAHADGTTATCSSTRGVEDTVTLHLSTWSANSNGNAWTAPTSNGDTSNGFNLGSALVVSGDAINRFIVDGVQSPKIVYSNTGDNYCEMEPPTFSFAQ